MMNNIYLWQDEKDKQFWEIGFKSSNTNFNKCIDVFGDYFCDLLGKNQYDELVNKISTTPIPIKLNIELI
jgi:hypothetical protein